jgi:hypothetical protein
MSQEILSLGGVQRPAAKPCSSSNSTFSLSWSSSHWSTTTRHGHRPSLSSLTFPFLRRYQRKFSLKPRYCSALYAENIGTLPEPVTAKPWVTAHAVCATGMKYATAGNVTVVVSSKVHRSTLARPRDVDKSSSLALDALLLTDVILIYSTISLISLIAV